MSTLKERMILEVEREIDTARKKKEELIAEAEQFESREVEARAMLQFLKTGQSIGNGTKRKILANHEEYMDAMRTLTHEQGWFNRNSLAHKLGVTSDAAGQKIQVEAKKNSIICIDDTKRPMRYRLPTS